MCRFHLRDKVVHIYDREDPKRVGEIVKVIPRQIETIDDPEGEERCSYHVKWPDGAVSPADEDALQPA